MGWGDVWCLREGEGYGGADQVEGAALGGGRGGELVDGLAADAYGVAGEGGQVVEQVAEAADGLPAGAGLEGGLGVCR